MAVKNGQGEGGELPKRGDAQPGDSIQGAIDRHKGKFETPSDTKDK